MKVKNLFLILLLFILLIPLVNAEIKLSPFSSTVYNLGDKVLIQGTLVHSNTTRANLNLFLNCGSNTIQVGTILLNLKAKQLESFSNLVTLPTDFNDLNGLFLDSKDFQAFDLTNELKGSFDINKNEFQLGDELSIKGTVTKQNNLVVNGVFVISFKQGDKLLFLDTVEVIDGVVDYNKFLNRILPGTYSIDILAKDNLGNLNSFNDLFKIIITGNLNINAVFDKNIYTPGDTLTINGYVGSSLNKELSNLDVDFNFENEIKTKQLAKSTETFVVNYNIQSNVKTGRHLVTVVASDDEGNYASNSIDFDVLAVPTKLNLFLDSNAYDPEEEIIFNVTLLDQAGDPISDNINVDLFDNKGKIILSKIVKAGQQNTFLLPKHASPGIWKLNSYGFGLEYNFPFTVNEYQRLDADIQGTNLIVNNVGNIPYKGLFEISGNDVRKTKDLKLKVGEKDEIKLDKLFSSGSYDFNLPSLGKSFDDIVIPEKKSLFGGTNKIKNKVTGNVARNTVSPTRRSLLFVALVVLCGCLIYLMFTYKGKFKKDKFGIKSSSDYIMGQRKLDELKSKGIRKDNRTVEYGKATKEDIDDWKRRVQESIKEHERTTSENEFVRHQQKSSSDDRPKGGLFNMFN
ncbi:hypothetical protein HYU23_03920 [Candidatus Woesearchaeota archaeon]|nr:hypothetical protein [Candidatus Woesearchaeota archaeon]